MTRLLRILGIASIILCGGAAIDSVSYRADAVERVHRQAGYSIDMPDGWLKQGRSDSFAMISPRGALSGVAIVLYDVDVPYRWQSIEHKAQESFNDVIQQLLDRGSISGFKALGSGSYTLGRNKVRWVSYRAKDMAQGLPVLGEYHFVDRGDRIAQIQASGTGGDANPKNLARLRAVVKSFRFD